ncbi:hypothetical protein L204_104620 [Cryptococcus depauperatus]|nr:hypothetical protein L204_03486 [Cryptococcus depauperatus CBS 7855]
MPSDRLLGQEAGSLLPRPAKQRIAQGPLSAQGQRSLYSQHVLDEDTYTEALSHIIQRDFFPDLPHLKASNDYLAALAENNPDLLSSAIRRLAALSQKKNKNEVSDNDEVERLQRQRDFAMADTPYINMPGSSSKLRTPVGTRGWDTPLGSTSRRMEVHETSVLSTDIGPSKPRKRQRKLSLVPGDVSLDTFQRNYTSEDNASFAQIIDEENRRKRDEKYGWAFEAEKQAEERRIEGEMKRKMILEAATSGNLLVNAEGMRLVGGLAEGGKDQQEGEAWKAPKLLESAPQSSSQIQGNLLQNQKDPISKDVVIHSSAKSTAIVKASQFQDRERLNEIPLPPKHPLAEALADAGLPNTALISLEDGRIVPQREAASGTGDGRGRGQDEQKERDQKEREIMGEERGEVLSLSGSGVDLWQYKARNNLMYPPDANTNPYPKPSSGSTSSSGLRPGITHGNTRLGGNEGGHTIRLGSTRGSSPTRSLIDAAVRGTPYVSDSGIPKVNEYSLLSDDPSPVPQNMPSLLTWGSLLATPRALDSKGDPLDKTPAYKMPEVKRRDELGRKLADKASKAMKSKAKGFTPRLAESSLNLSRKEKNVRALGNMGPPSTPRRQADSLTPAAKRLLDRTVNRAPIGNTQSSAIPRNRTNGGPKGFGQTGATSDYWRRMQ